MEQEVSIEAPDKLPIVFVSVQYENINSGPGTFTVYTVREFKNHPLFDFYFFVEDLKQSDSRIQKVDIPSNKLLGNRILKGLLYYLRIQPFLNTQTPKIVWFNTSPVVTYFYTLLGKADYLVSMISDDNLVTVSSRWDFKKSMLRLFEKHTLKSADMVVVNSQYLADTVKSMYRIEPEKIRVLYKAVSTDDFQFKPPEKEIKLPVQIIFIKSDYKRGGLFDLLQAVKSLHFELQLTVVGPDGEHIEHIREFAKKINYQAPINYLGKLPRNQVIKAIRSSDVLCVPSKKEALGVVFLEAMSCGIAVIGSNTGGIPEALDHGKAGWLCQPNNISDLAKTLHRCIHENEQRIAKINHARKFVEQFDLNSFRGRMEVLLTEISENFQK